MKKEDIEREYGKEWAELIGHSDRPVVSQSKVPICGYVFSWDDKHKVPLDQIIHASKECKSDKIFRFDNGYNDPTAIIGANTIDEAKNIALNILYEENYDPHTEKYRNLDLIFDEIEASVTPWGPEYNEEDTDTLSDDVLIGDLGDFDKILRDDDIEDLKK